MFNRPLKFLPILGLSFFLPAFSSHAASLGTEDYRITSQKIEFSPAIIKSWARTLFDENVYLLFRDLRELDEFLFGTEISPLLKDDFRKRFNQSPPNDTLLQALELSHKPRFVGSIGILSIPVGVWGKLPNSFITRYYQHLASNIGISPPPALPFSAIHSSQIKDPNVIHQVIRWEGQTILPLHAFTWNQLKMEIRAGFVKSVAWSIQPPNKSIDILWVRLTPGKLNALLREFIPSDRHDEVRLFYIHQMHNNPGRVSSGYWLPLSELIDPKILERVGTYEECATTNCFTTALILDPEANPDRILSLEPSQFDQILQKRYKPVPPNLPFQLHEIFVFRESGVAQHAALHVGGGWVFTKDSFSRFAGYRLEPYRENYNTFLRRSAGGEIGLNTLKVERYQKCVDVTS